MLAEAAHSLADTTNQVFLRISLSRAERGKDERHPFGYGQERFFWAFLAAVFIFVAGALFSGGQGGERVFSTSTAEGGDAIEVGGVVGGVAAEGTDPAPPVRPARRGGRGGGLRRNRV